MAKIGGRAGFEHRSRHNDSSDGAAFQAFVAECLSRLASPGERIKSYPALGRDGAIDLVVEGGARAFVECKFHARSRNDPAISDWRATAKILRKNLGALTLAEPDGVSSSPYAPWLERDRPVSEYWFCTSAEIAHEAQDARIAAEIISFFQELAASSPKLSHLASVRVEVRGWSYFEEALLRLPSLRYRWFGGLPAGLRLLDRFTGPAGSFRQFLDNENLPYFSLNVFVGTGLAGPGVSFPSIDALVDQLLEDPRAALVISGAGGMGKTRMALEIGRAASERGLLTVSASTLAGKDALEVLVSANADPSDIIVLIDYAEAFDALDRFVAAADILAAEGHRIHLIATCRNSALSRVGRAMTDLVLRTVILDGFGTPGGKSYASWVVDQILESTELSDRGLNTLCRGFPVLAAFALYLIREGPDQFRDQFGSLSEDLTFERWVSSRLAAAFGRSGSSGSNWPRRLAVLAASLQLGPDEVRQLRDGNDGSAELLDVLEADQWVESEAGSLLAAHDIFADAIVSHYLFEKGKPAQARLGDIIFDGHSLGSLGRVLTALDRLSSRPEASSLELLPVLRELHARDEFALARAATAILRSRLLDAGDLINLLSLDRRLGEAIQTNRKADGLLNWLTKTVTESEDQNFRTIATETLLPLLDAAVRAPQPSNMILRRAFELVPDNYRSMVRAVIEQNPATHEMHYLLAAWLRHAPPDDALQEHVLSWLSRWSGTSSKASFILQGWLRLTNETDLVRDHMRVWLDAHRSEIDAQFVYGSWLDAGGGVEAIAADVRVWLDVHRSQADSRFVYGSWLNAGGGVEAIAMDVRVWLDAHRAEAGAGFLYRSWLEAGGGVEPVATDVRVWLDVHRAEVGAQFVYTGWLNAGGGVEAVTADVRVWLDVHRAEVGAQFVYKGWLNAGGGVEAVAADVRVWLDAHRTHADARFVYCSWLDAGGGVEAVATDVRVWLDLHRTEAGAGFICGSWLEAGGSFAEIRDAVICWFEIHKAEEQCVYVTKYIVRQSDLPLTLVADLLFWCRRHAYLRDAVCRSQSLMRYFKSKDDKRIVYDIYLDILERIDRDDSEDYGVFVATITTISQLFFWNMILGDDNVARIQRLDSLHIYLMRDFDIYRDRPVHKSNFPRNKVLIRHITKIIRIEKDYFSKNPETIISFLQWISKWPVRELIRFEKPIDALVSVIILLKWSSDQGKKALQDLLVARRPQSL